MRTKGHTHLQPVPKAARKWRVSEVAGVTAEAKHATSGRKQDPVCSRPGRDGEEMIFEERFVRTPEDHLTMFLDETVDQVSTREP